MCVCVSVRLFIVFAVCMCVCVHVCACVCACVRVCVVARPQRLSLAVLNLAPPCGSLLSKYHEIGDGTPDEEASRAKLAAERRSGFCVGLCVSVLASEASALTPTHAPPQQTSLEERFLVTLKHPDQPHV